MLGRLCHLFPFLFFSSICLYFLAKYTYVFKSFIFNHGEIDEEKILKWIRVVNATVAITLNFIGKKKYYYALKIQVQFLLNIKQYWIELLIIFTFFSSKQSTSWPKMSTSSFSIRSLNKDFMIQMLTWVNYCTTLGALWPFASQEFNFTYRIQDLF